MMTRRLLRSTALLAILAMPLAAQADPRDDARRHFRAGLEAARTGDYEQALERFLQAQDAYPHPTTLYNIARAYQDLGDLENAVATYQIFREAAPERADEVDPIIAVLRAQLTPEPSEAEPVATTGGTATASAEEVARLQALLGEMGELVARITTESETTEAEATGEPAEVDSDVAEALAALPSDSPSFQDDAYERVVVTASRFGQAPLDSPSTISVITADDIRLSGLTNIPDLLRRVVGVEAMSKSAGHTDISIRGFNRELNNKVLVLVDGRTTTWDFLGSTLWNTLPISIDDIDRIEVIRGPGSAIYGANAMTGVVNIITRTPGEGDNTVRFQAGTPGVAEGSVLLTGRKGADAWRLSAGWQDHNRWGTLIDNEQVESLQPFFEDAHRAVRVLRANGRLDHAFAGKGLVSFTAGYSDARVETYNIGVLGDYGFENQHLTLRTDLAYGPFQLRAYWNHDDGATGPWLSNPNASLSLYSEFIADTFDVEATASGELTTGSVEHKLFGGVGYRRKEIRDFLYLGDDGPLVTQNHFHAFLNEEASVGSVKLVGTVRADLHPLIPLERTISPRAAAIVRLGNDRALRINGGRAFRGPTLVESYMDFRIPGTADGVFVRDYGSTTLLPERILTGEIGFHDESSDLHTADVAVYVNHIANPIGLDSVTPTAVAYEPAGNGWQVGETGWINLDPESLGWGVEAEGEIFPTDGVDLYASVNVSSIIDQDNGTTTPDRSTSLFKSTAGASWRTPWRLDLSADVQVYSAQTWGLRQFDAAGQIQVNNQSIPAHAIASARIAFRPLTDEKLELSVQGWNLGALGGDGVREHPTGQLVRSRVTGAVRYTF